MPKFNVEYQWKTQVWESAKMEIEANTMEEALEMVKEAKLYGFDEFDPEYEQLFETSENMTPEQNNGESTVDIFINNEKVYENAQLRDIG